MWLASPPVTVAPAGAAVAVGGAEMGGSIAVKGAEGSTETKSLGKNAGGVGSAVASVAAHSGHSPFGDSSASGFEHRVQELGDGTRKPGLFASGRHGKANRALTPEQVVAVSYSQ